MTLIEWAIKHNVSNAALDELRESMGLNGTASPYNVAISEAGVQSRVRLEAGRKGLKLFRNNVGVLKNEYGVPVRYGLANDSPQLNRQVKSSDLIGWRAVTIGTVRIAQFVARECKEPGWTYSGTDREVAQRKFIEAVRADGGDAMFCTGEGTL